MLSPEALAAYRAMGPARRLKLTFRAIRENTPHLFSGTAVVVKRRLDLIRRNHDEHSRLLRQRLAEAEWIDAGS